ncbi:MAG: AAA family ATPase [Elusimicrobia bacterium]|nr:AAA family ATPase [Elusimicrobiota bacterium]
MTQENQQSQQPAGVQLVAPRPRRKTGLPTEGLAILVGQPKSGKTTFGASFEGAYVLECELGGGDRVAGRIHDIANVAEFRETLKAVMREPAIKTVVIDSLDVLSDWLEDEIARARGLDSITERKQGVDGFELWGEYRKRIEALVAYLKASRKLVILIAHCKEPKLDSGGNLVSPAGINMPGKAGAFIAAQADMIGYCFKKPLGSGTAYFVTFQGGPLGTWGSRVDELNDKTLQLPRENPYSAFEAVFKAEAPAKPASQETKPAKAGGKR